MVLVTFLLLSYGITNIAIFGSIFEGWRNFCKKISPSFFGKLFSCPMCLSTWVGFVLSYTLLTFGFDTPMFNYGVDIVPLAIFLDGCLTSGGVWIIHNFEEMLERAFYYDEK